MSSEALATRVLPVQVQATPGGRALWETATLGDVVDTLIAGVSVNADNRQIGEGEIGVLKTSCVSGGQFLAGEHKSVLTDELDRARTPVRAGSIIISRMNTPALVGANAYVDEDHPDLFLPDRLWQLRTSDRADSRWLSYSMQSASFRSFIDDIATGTSGSMKNISKERLLQAPLALPPLDEQRRIAEVLRSVDEAMACADAVARQAQALWHSLTESLIWKIQMDSPANIRPLGDAVQSSDYGVNAPLGNEPAGYAVLRMGNLQDGWIDRADLKWGDIGDQEALALTLEVGDILFNRTNSRELVGKVALVREPTDDLYASYIVRLRVNRRVADPHYLFAVMHSRRAQGQFKSIATPGVSQSNINPTNLKKQLIPLPSLSEQQAIASRMQAVERARRCAVAELSAIRRIKADLMSDLLSGRVRVPE